MDKIQVIYCPEAGDYLTGAERLCGECSECSLDEQAKGTRYQDGTVIIHDAMVDDNIGDDPVTYICINKKNYDRIPEILKSNVEEIGCNAIIIKVI